MLLLLIENFISGGELNYNKNWNNKVEILLI
jgi:hypothetical protein